MNKKTVKRGQDENHTLRGRTTGKVRKVKKVEQRPLGVDLSIKGVNSVGKLISSTAKHWRKEEKSHMSWFNEGKYLHGKAVIH